MLVKEHNLKYTMFIFHSDFCNLLVVKEHSNDPNYAL